MLNQKLVIVQSEVSSVSKKGTVMFKSRFGYHPCDRETYLKLKKLHKAYWEALYQFHVWNRWQRKDPQNRHGDEPKLSDLFVVNQPWWRVTYRHNDKGEEYAFYKSFPKTVTDHGIKELYQKARMPSMEPVEPFSDEELKLIDDLYQKIN